MDFSPKQIDAWNNVLTNDSFTRIQFEGGSRSGKTFLICWWILKLADQYPGSRHLVARFARVKANGTIWQQTLLPMAKTLERYGAAKINYSNLRIDFLNGSYVVVDGLEPSRIEGVLGAEYSTVFINECNENKWGTIELLFSRLTQTCTKHSIDKQGNFLPDHGKPIIPKLITDLNPTTKTSWHYKLFHLKQDPVSQNPRPDAKNITYVHFRPSDNIKNQAKGYIETLESGSEQFRKRFLYGEYGSFEGLVYTEFNPDVHVIDHYELPQKNRRGNYTFGRAIDFGFWPDPFVCLWFCHDIAQGKVIIYREWYQRKVIVRDHAKHIYRLSYEDLPEEDKKKFHSLLSGMNGKDDPFGDTDDFYHLLKRGRMKIIQNQYDFTVCDHDSEDRATLHAALIETESADKRRHIGFEHVSELLSHSEHKRPTLYVTRDCTNTITEFESYRWAAEKDDDKKKKDRATANGDDHAMDALRYGMMKLIPPSKGDLNVFIGRNL